MKLSHSQLPRDQDETRAYDLTEQLISSRSHQRSEGSNAFVREPLEEDRLRPADADVNELAQESSLAAISGEEEGHELLPEESAEERGDLFVEESAWNQFADDVEDTNPGDAAHEPLPSPMRGL